MAIHFRILAWKILWTEEPSELQSIGSQRVGHDLVTAPEPLEEECHLSEYKKTKPSSIL